jgi:serine/threonine protein kinase
MMVLNYAKNGSLRNYLDVNYNKLSWMDKISDLYDIAKGLESIHNNNLIHRDLHVGNILHNGCLYITDMGLCKPADYNPSENTETSIYGVLPYIAPEILREQKDYTIDSDIYSFGIIMYEVISGLPPYNDVSHDENLAIKICKGLRPRFNIKVPQLIVHLIKKCLDANPLSRPTTKEIADTLGKLKDGLFLSNAEIRKQIEEANKMNNNLSKNNVPLTNLSYSTHSEAIYTSKLLNFNNLPEPKNSDDFYKKTDNIISLEYSGNNQFISL